MNQSQLNEAYKAKHMLTIFPPAPHVLSTFLKAARLAAQSRDEQDQLDANFGDTFGTQEGRNQPQRVTFN